MALANPSDVTTSMMRDLTPAESQHVDALLERAERKIRARVPDLDARRNEDHDFRQRVIDITAEAVARVFRNPAGYTQENEGNYGYQLNFRVASGLLDILDSEWAELGVGGGLGTIMPTVDGYAAARFRGRPDLAFQYEWHGCYPGMSEVWP